MFEKIFYSENRLLRSPEFFSDESWIEARLRDRNTRIVPVWRNRNLIRNEDSPAAIALSGDHARGLLEIAGEIALLGVDAGRGESPYIAVDISEHDLPTLTPLMGQAEFLDLRQVGVLMDGHDGSLLAHARGLMYWHRHSRYCSDCGNPTQSAEAGRMRRCTNDQCGRDHFPRTDPAVIMLVTRPGPEGGACLLGRHPNLPEGIYSTLAGFVDQGESLEQAVVREVFEEAGIHVDDVQYRASQPWPFPASLMLGYRARATSVEIDIGEDELEDARWFTKTQVANIEDLNIRLPRKDSIAYWLIAEWLAED
jgi:NAD+ diphosphatase